MNCNNKKYLIILIYIVICLFYCCSCNTNKEIVKEINEEKSLDFLDKVNIDFKINTNDNKKTVYIYNSFSLCVVDNETNCLVINKPINFIPEYMINKIRYIYMNDDEKNMSGVKDYFQYDEVIFKYDKPLFAKLDELKDVEESEVYDGYLMGVQNCSWIGNSNKLLISFIAHKITYYIFDIDNLTMQEIDVCGYRQFIIENSKESYIIYSTTKIFPETESAERYNEEKHVEYLYYYDLKALKKTEISSGLNNHDFEQHIENENILCYIDNLGNEQKININNFK